MSNAYATLEDFIPMFPSLSDPTDPTGDLQAVAMQALLDASRQIETELGCRVGYFNKANGVATSREVRSFGTRFFRLDPFVGDALVVRDGLPLSEDVYYLQRPIDYNDITSFRVAFRNSGWKCGGGYSKITVTADWGFPCVPEDILIATKNLAGMIFLASPQISYPEEMIDKQRDRMAESFKSVMLRWHHKFYHLRNMGVASNWIS